MQALLTGSLQARDGVERQYLSHRDMKPDNIIIHHGTNNLHEEAEPQVVANDIFELAQSTKIESGSNVIISAIVPGYGKLNEKVRTLNHLLRIYCKNSDIGFLSHENINPKKHCNNSGLHLNYLGNPILTVNFLNAMNDLDWEH